MSLAPIGLALWLAQSAAPAAAPASAGAAAAPAAKSTAVARPKPPEGLSWEDADQMAETVARLERRLRAAAGELVAREIAVFITGRALTIVRKGCRAQVMLTGGPGLRWR